ncbi:MAG: PAS domain S-box protein [Chloroflexi bacterium]|nr:PAS domain S-box protein [Chloroflexota bacterium]
MATLLHALIVEDSEDDMLLIVRQLKQGGYDPVYERVDTPDAMSAAMDRQTWDIVIADYAMPHFSGLDALRLLKSKKLGVPFILVSGTIGEDTAVAAMKAGAQDYIMKSNLARLSPAVERELREAAVRRARAKAEDELRRSDERFRLTVEGVRDYAIFMLDAEGRIINWNAGAERIFGYQAKEIIGQPLTRFFTEEDVRQGRPEQALKLAAAQGRFEEEGWRRRKDWSQFWADSVITTQRDEAGNLRAFVQVARDITERKQSQEEIKRQLERLGALRAIETAISASLDLRVTLSIILDQVTTQLQVDAADVLLLDHAMQTLEYAASRGFRSQNVNRTRLRLGEGYAGRSALDRGLVSVSDLREAEDEFARAHGVQEEDFVSYYAVPLIAKGQVKGVLEIFHRALLNPDQGWIDFLHALVGQAAIAIDNATMFDELQRSNTELLIAYNATIEGWSHALDLRDRETEGHTQRVAEMAERLARAMGMSEANLVHLRRGALLHDIGKMGIPDEILHKRERLSDEEQQIMRKHPMYAYEWLSPIEFLEPALDIPYNHHERWNGDGYPRGLRGEAIPLAARIFAVVDVWDALSSDRPYRDAWPHERVIDYLREQSNVQFDPGVVEAFVRLLENEGGGRASFDRLRTGERRKDRRRKEDRLKIW